MALSLARYTVPPDHVVDRLWQAWDGHLYHCQHRDLTRGFWMEQVGEPSTSPTAIAGSWSRYVDGALLGWTWHLAKDQSAQGLAA